MFAAPMMMKAGAGGGGGGISYAGGNTALKSGGTMAVSLAALSLQEGDLVLAFSAQSGGFDDAGAVGMVSAGWAELSGSPLSAGAAGARDSALGGFFKVMGATPDSSVEFDTGGGDGQVAAVMAFRGVDPTTPFDVAPVATEATYSSTVAFGNVTPVTSGAWIVVAGSQASLSLPDYTDPGYPGGFASVLHDPGTAALLGVAYDDGWTSGAYDPEEFGGTTMKCNFVIALRPA